ncbi:MAG: DegT/DnrJ/EryC1/StrS family aminotransferase [Lachnospiraceae bacterium]|nr:DegT/DnrJ/EryC1/StrS family aminotransferase [Lachnospiraceae bacterium]
MSRDKLALFGGMPVREKPYTTWPEFSDADCENLLQILKSGVWSRAKYTNHLKFQYENESEIAKFEQRFGSFLGTRYGIFVNSGTSALHLAFAGLDLKEGSEVITTPYTFFSTIAPLYKYRLKPVFVDIDESGNIDGGLIEAKITSKTKAVLILHCAGYPCDMEKIKRICEEHNLFLVQDCAHAISCNYNHKHVASFGDISIFSFEASKNLNCGEGGFVAVNDEKLFERMFSIQSCGRPLGEDWRSHINMSENYRPTEFQASIALTQLDKVQDQEERRIKNRILLDKLLKDNPLLEPIILKKPATSHGNYSYLLIIKKEYQSLLSGKRLAIYLETEGIPCHCGYKELVYNLKFCKQFYSDEMRREMNSQFPTAMRFSKSLVWLPQTILLSSAEDVEDVIKAINKVLEYYSK